MDITKRELAALSTAIVYGWQLEISPRGTACWDGDSLLPFRAFASLESLVSKGLMLELPGAHGWRYFRATPEAAVFRCNAAGCQRGWVYVEDAEVQHRRSSKCELCGGKGAVMTPNT